MLSIVGCCLLFAVSCQLIYVCCLLCVVVVCLWLFVVRCSLFVVRCLLLSEGCRLFVDYCCLCLLFVVVVGGVSCVAFVVACCECLRCLIYCRLSFVVVPCWSCDGFWLSLFVGCCLWYVDCVLFLVCYVLLFNVI